MAQYGPCATLPWCLAFPSPLRTQLLRSWGRVPFPFAQWLQPGDHESLIQPLSVSSVPKTTLIQAVTSCHLEHSLFLPHLHGGQEYSCRCTSLLPSLPYFCRTLGLTFFFLSIIPLGDPSMSPKLSCLKLC